MSIKRVRVGESLGGWPVDSWNRVADAVESIESQSLAGTRPPEQLSARACVPMRVQNTTGRRLEVGEIVGIGGPIFTVAQVPNEIAAPPRFKVIPPTEDGRYAIVLTPMDGQVASSVTDPEIPTSNPNPDPPGPQPSGNNTQPPSGGTNDQAFGWVAVDGWAWAKVDFGDDTEATTAGPIDDEYHLKGGGQGVIIHHQEGGDGIVDCVVSFTDDNGPKRRLARAEQEIAPGSSGLAKFEDSGEEFTAYLTWLHGGDAVSDGAKIIVERFDSKYIIADAPCEGDLE